MMERPELSCIDLNADNIDRILPQLHEFGEVLTKGEDGDADDDGWLVACLKCINCFKRWVGVYPAACDAPFMECPRCGKLAGEKQLVEIDPDDESFCG